MKRMKQSSSNGTTELYPATVQWLPGGPGYFSNLLSLIRSATFSIHLQTYIYADDEAGRLVAAALTEAAGRGVKVYLLADGYASQSLPSSFISEMRSAGIRFRFFEPLFRSAYFYLGRRMHHKIIVIDERMALVGGLNISDHYRGTEKQLPWLDFALQAEGPVAKALCVVCSKTWNSFRSGQPASICSNQPPPTPGANACPVGIRRNDWVRHKNEISASYIRLLREARQEVTILSSYFLPGRVIRRLLKAAVKRGVKITVITAGPSDVMLAKYGERWLYNWLLRNHIGLYEYQPTILHAKLAIADDQWFTLGSYNVNNISAYASVELNLDVHSPSLTGSLRAHIQEHILQHSIPITEQWQRQHQPVFTRLLQWGAYQLIRIIFFSLTFYFKQRAARKNAGRLHHPAS